MSYRVTHLSAANLANLAPSASEASAAIERFFALKARGSVHYQPKLTMVLGPGHLFQSLCCAVSDPPLAICKWIGVSGRNSERGLPNVSGIAILSDAETGMPLAILDAAALTAVRTAAMSLFAAQHFVPSGARTIGLVGSGVQARSHLTLFAQAFPELREVRILGGFRGSEALSQHAEVIGLSSALCNHADAVLAGADIVISSVPASGGPMLDARLLKPGCFVSAVDLGRSWLPESLSCFDILATDDHENSANQQALGIMPPIGEAQVDLADLASGKHRGRASDDQRVAFIFPGHALSDLALAAYFIGAAQRRGIGTEIAL